MLRVLLIWELGGGFGHYSTLLPVAEEFARRQCQPYLSLQDLASSQHLLANSPFPLLQSPLWLHVPANSATNPLSSYSDILKTFGFLHPIELSGMVKAWRGMYDLVNPDLLVFNHAPTALLAARGLKIPKVTLGSGFFIPPKTDPFPPFYYWRENNLAKQKSQEQRILNSVNQVLEKLSVPVLNSLPELLAVDCDFITAFPEYDHYPFRHGGAYAGPISVDDEGATPVWPGSGEKRIFVYVISRFPGLINLIEGLLATNYHILMYVKGASSALIQKYECKRLHFSTIPVKLEEVIPQADLAITHAGIGTTMNFVMGGIPLLLLPRQTEQYLFSKRVVERGSAIVLDADNLKPEHYTEAVHKLIRNKKYTILARKIAESHKHYNQSEQIEKIVSKCIELMKNG
ncbi:MAG TPA: nucleotide disphospho-sugar-binding domain-containing protein [Gammaproteobacteria bacterium]